MISAPASPAITGTTDVYLIIGDPVEQVRAPESFNRIFAAMGIDAVLVPVHVAPDHLEAFVKAVFTTRNISGLWATIPHKTPLVDLLDRCSDLGRLAGAVNAVRRNANGTLEGGLFDGEGFMASLAYFGLTVAGKRVLMLGAGGAAAAIGVSLACTGTAPVAELALFDPAAGRAQQIVERLAPASRARLSVAASNDPAGFDLVINASPLGLKPGDPLPCDVARLSSGAALVDILMKHQPTPVVRAARARGLVAHPGFEMMIQQTHLYLDFFGFHEAAARLREDATFVRELIYPETLHGEIRRPAAAGFSIPEVEGSRLALHPNP